MHLHLTNGGYVGKFTDFNETFISDTRSKNNRVANALKESRNFFKNMISILFYNVFFPVLQVQKNDLCVCICVCGQSN